MFALFLLHAASATPFILFDKKLSDENGKVGEPVHVIYQIHNLGDAPASDLHIDDSGIPLEQWDFPQSANNLRWNVIEPGQNITHIFEATPRVAGNLRMGSSRLRFVTDGQKKIALSSQLFWFDSKSTRSIGAKSNLIGYAIVVAASVSSILVPFFVWSLTKVSAKPKKD